MSLSSKINVFPLIRPAVFERGALMKQPLSGAYEGIFSLGCRLVTRILSQTQSHCIALHYRWWTLTILLWSSFKKARKQSRSVSYSHCAELDHAMPRQIAQNPGYKLPSKNLPTSKRNHKLATRLEAGDDAVGGVLLMHLSWAFPCNFSQSPSGLVFDKYLFWQVSETSESTVQGGTTESVKTRS